GERIRGNQRAHRINSGIAHAIDELLGVATMRAGERIRAEDDFEPGNLDRAPDEIVVDRQDALHRRESLFSVAGRAEEALLISEAAPPSFCLRTKARISSGVPVFSPRPSSGSTAVRMRGPGSAPFAISSRSGTSMGEPTLCTVVKPAINVSQALDAAWYAANCVVSSAPAFLPFSPKLQVMWTCESIQPGRTVKPRRS